MFLSRTQPLSNSCVSFPLFVCTHREGWVQPGRSGRGGILGALTRGSYHRGRGWEPARMGAPQSPGKLVEEQRLLQELHLALDRALRWPPEHWWSTGPVGASLSRIGEGQLIFVQILPDLRGRRRISVSSPASQQGQTRTPRGPRLFLP